MDLTLLETSLRERGEPAYRSGQVWEWTARGAESYEAMTNLPRALREELTAAVPFSTLEVEVERESKDGTVKTLFRTADGHPVEAVLMRYRDGRRSLCLSSQSGCPLTCTFCATGAMAFGRNLTASEILDQALHFRRRTEVDVTSGSRGDAAGAGAEGTVLDARARKRTGRQRRQASAEPGSARREPSPAGGPTHAVFMGMGEPMLNLDEVLAAARRLPEIGITHRRTTISTVGWIPGLKRFVREVDEPIRLALSLHAADGALRSQLMPVNDRYPLTEVLALCHEHAERTNRRVFVEYVMLAGVNDAPEQARALAHLLGRDHFKVNLIPYNPIAGSAGGEAAGARQEDRPPKAAGGGHFDGSSRDRIGAFKAVLDRAHVPATVRLTRGRDIEAACGQLAAAPKSRKRAAVPTP
ncbi:MAG TPA: 23S rRNA (adenine(2503)-C(2))-methyltransferase RlmN [Gaiellaceae bacterium]|nr:23S rRNA (adenine(2503)-C(2))-methyltransferase RlmN [Gaiellaceae bacterium]